MSLDPHIRNLIAAFRRQRRAALTARCLLSISAIGCFATMIAALLDRLFLLSDASRAALGMSIYLFCFAFLIVRHGNQIREKQDARNIALMFESTRPELCGELLSVIEFSEQGLLKNCGPDAANQFADMLHHKTRAALNSINPAILFPFRLLWSDVRLFGSSLLILVSACILGGANFRAHCKRVLLPFANIERISDTLITLTARPTLDGVIPADEEFSVEADVRNHNGHPAFVEVLRKSQPIRKIPLSRIENSSFIASLNAQKEPFAYRVRCNDAATRYHHCTPVPRPAVNAFRKQYAFPEYTRLGSRTELNQDGHLKAVAGTQVFLEIEADQPVASGHILFQDGSNSTSLALRSDPQNPAKFLAAFEISKSCHYQLELVAAATGFRSRPDLLYEIQAEADLPPDISLETPAIDIVSPITERVRVAGHVSDDYLVTNIWIESRINAEAWNAEEILSENLKSKSLDLLVDPLALNGKIGDILSVRFSATDSKGQRGESNVVKISLGHSIKSETKDMLSSREAEIERQLDLLQRHISEAQQQLSNAATSQSSNSRSSDKTALSTVAKRSLENAIQTSNEIRESLRSALAKNATDETRGDLQLAARALNQLQFISLQPALQSLNRLSAEKTYESAEIQSAKDLTAHADTIQKSVHQAVRSTFASRLGDQLSQDSIRLLKDRRQLQEQTSTIADYTSSNGVPLPSDSSNDAVSRLDQLNRAEMSELGRTTAHLRELSRSASDKLSSLPEKLQSADATAEKLQQALHSTSKSLEELKPKLLAEAASARAQLERALSSDSANLQRVKREIDEIARRKENKPERQSSLAQAKVESIADLLRADAQLESDRPDAPATLAYSLHQASRALDALIERQSTAAETLHPLEILGSAVRTIEAVAKLEEAGQLAQRAARDASNAADAQALSKITNKLGRSLATLPKDLDKSGLSEATLEKSRNAITKAQNPADAASLLLDASDSSVEIVSMAKSAIDALAPSLASEMQSLSLQSQRAADTSIALSKGEPSRDAIQKAASAEHRLGAKIENLREALRARANTADFLTEDGRQQSRDADAAGSLLKSPERAALILQAAAQRLKESGALLPKAADLQLQNARNLQQLAQHFENFKNGDADGTAKSRESLRDSERSSGAKPELDERQAKAEAISEMAKSLQKDTSPDPAAEPKDEAKDAGAKSKPSTSTESNRAADSPPNSKPENKSDSQSSSRAVQAAIDAQKQADRIARAGHSTLSGAPATASQTQQTDQAGGELPAASLKGDQDWGRLPKRIATDLMQGRREPISGEYQSAIEAYFRAIAERAQQPAKSAR